MFPSLLLHQLRRILLTVLLGGLLGATLVRLGPGFGVDEREMDNRLSSESRQAIRSEHAAENNIALFYLRYLAGLAHGDLGFSRSLNRPVSELLKQRLPLTLVSLTYGVFGGVSIGLALALLTVWWRAPGFRLVAFRPERLVFGGSRGGDRFGVPLDGRAWPLGDRLSRLPARLPLCQELIGRPGYQSPHVLAAEAKGLSSVRVLFAHVMLPATPQLAALAGISVSLAFGASIPIEVICDTPGIGQLAWRAALDRDLPLLVNITVLVALMTLVVNSLADLALASRRPGQ